MFLTYRCAFNVSSKKWANCIYNKTHTNLIMLSHSVN